MAEVSKFKPSPIARSFGVSLLVFSVAAMVLLFQFIIGGNGDIGNIWAAFFILFCLFFLLSSLPLIYFGNFKRAKKYIAAIWENFTFPL